MTPDRSTGFRGASEALALYDPGPQGAPLAVTETQIRYVTAGSPRPLLGAFAELRLPRNLALQASVFFRRDTAKSHVVSFDGYKSQWSHAKYQLAAVNTWEIPVLLKYRFEAPRVRPFIAGGPAFRIWDLNNLYGASAAAGVDLRWRRKWVVTLQTRYTRWGASRLGHRAHTSRNQIQTMIGLAY